MSEEYKIQSNFNKDYSIVSRKITRLLSENARMPVMEIAAKTGISRPTAKERLSKLQSGLGMKYTLEMDERMLGFSNPHLIAVRFRQKPSDYGKIKELLLKSYVPQLAFATKGAYDMVIYANAFSSRDYVKWDRSMRILLGEYNTEWRQSEVVHRQLGFFPVRDEAISKSRIDGKYKSILRLLNENSRMSFQQISKELGMHFNTVKYNYYKLIELGYIKRPTITMDLIKGISFMTFFSSYTLSEEYENESARARLAFMSDDENPILSRYLICAPLIGNYDFFTLGVFDNSNIAYKADIRYHKRLFAKNGIKIDYAEVSNVLLGRVPIRNVDIRKEYNKVAWVADFGEETFQRA